MNDLLISVVSLFEIIIPSFMLYYCISVRLCLSFILKD